MLLRKQTSISQVFSTKLAFKPSARGYEAGVVLYWNHYSYATVGIVADEEDGNLATKVVVREPQGKAGEFKVFPTTCQKDKS